MSFACHSYVIHISLVVTLCHSYAIHMLLLCRCMYSFVCHSYVPLFHQYATGMYLCLMHATCMYLHIMVMSPVHTLIPSVCYLYVFVCLPYVTCVYSYVIRISLVCTFTMNRFYVIWILVTFSCY